MLYELQCNMNDKDFYECSKYTLFHAPAHKREFRRLQLFVPVLLTIFLLIKCLDGVAWTDLIFDILLRGMVSIAWVLLLKPFYMFLMDIRFRQMKKKEKLPYTPEATMQFYEDHFTEITPDTKMEMKYSVVERICVPDSGDIYIYQNTSMAFIVPFGAFETDAQRSNFLQFIQEKTSCTIEL